MCRPDWPSAGNKKGWPTKEWLSSQVTLISGRVHRETDRRTREGGAHVDVVTKRLSGRRRRLSNNLGAPLGEWASGASWPRARRPISGQAMTAPFWLAGRLSLQGWGSLVGPTGLFAGKSEGQALQDMCCSGDSCICRFDGSSPSTLRPDPAAIR